MKREELINLASERAALAPTVEKYFELTRQLTEELGKKVDELIAEKIQLEEKLAEQARQARFQERIISLRNALNKEFPLE